MKTIIINNNKNNKNNNRIAVVFIDWRDLAFTAINACNSFFPSILWCRCCCCCGDVRGVVILFK